MSWVSHLAFVEGKIVGCEKEGSLEGVREGSEVGLMLSVREGTIVD